ncbi:MAG: adenosine kinase [Spirochaetes bacterium]|nr:adenosine kinase [Spirochaetota bacterium]
MKIAVYGIENPLIDIIVRIEEKDLLILNKTKGTMALIDEKEREKLIKFIENREKTFSCGGSAPNTMITLSAMGIKTALGGKIGEDEFGSIYQERLKKHPNITSALVKGSKLPTGSSIILITPDSERTMNTFLGANREFSEKDVDEKILDNSDFFYFTGYMWDTENQKAAVEKCLHICKKKKIKIAFDVADPFAVQRNKNDFLQIIEKNADYVFANNEEASSLFDSADPLKAATIIAEMGKTCAVKWGKQGSVIKEPKKEILRIPIIEDKGCVDTTGAGDTYAAGFFYGICRGKDLETAGRCASFLASAIVSKIGAQFTEEESAELAKKIQLY